MKPPADYEIPETEPPGPDRRVLAVALALGALFGFIAGYAMGDVPVYEPEARFEMCEGKC